jgi:hypothetical protein
MLPAPAPPPSPPPQPPQSPLTSCTCDKISITVADSSPLNV